MTVRANLTRKTMMNPTGLRLASLTAAIAVTFAVALAVPQAADAREVKAQARSNVNANVSDTGVARYRQDTFRARISAQNFIL